MQTMFAHQLLLLLTIIVTQRCTGIVVTELFVRESNMREEPVLNFVHVTRSSVCEESSVSHACVQCV